MQCHPGAPCPSGWWGGGGEGSARALNKAENGTTVYAAGGNVQSAIYIYAQNVQTVKVAEATTPGLNVLYVENIRRGEYTMYMVCYMYIVEGHSGTGIWNAVKQNTNGVVVYIECLVENC